MAKRVESPSSINTYKQCPRKYYYQYIRKLDVLPNVHQIRGSITHKVLENFFRVDITKVSKKNYKKELLILIMDMLVQEWKNSLSDFKKCKLSYDQIDFYFDETKMMLGNWFNNFMDKVEEESLSLDQAFKKWTPIREEKFVSEKLAIRGFVDAIHEIENNIFLLDYKTSRNDDFKQEYKLQLAIYALLYLEKYKKAPKRVGINFLKHGEKYIKVDKELLKFARKECELIHKNTESDNMNDYPRKESPLCRWSTGQCDFYDICSEEV